MTVERPNLLGRKALSKSALNTFDACQSKSWFDLHEPRPFIVNEKIAFGSALDAGTEALVMAVRDGREVNVEKVAAESITYVFRKDEIEVPLDELTHALRGFVSEVMPRFDWTGAGTQPSIDATIDGLGPCNGHPDFVLANNEVWDVKSSSREKVIPSVELGFYALLLEEGMGVPVARAGYLTWVRLKKPYWSIQPMEITPEVRRWTWENARRYAAARDLDAQLNEGADQPINVVFAGGPKFGCSDCSYNPANGGRCAITYQGGAA